MAKFYISRRKQSRTQTITDFHDACPVFHRLTVLTQYAVSMSARKAVICASHVVTSKRDNLMQINYKLPLSILLQVWWL